MKRRHFIRTISLSIGGSLLCSPNKIFAEEHSGSEMNYPQEVFALINEQLVKLNGKEGNWEFNGCSVKLDRRKTSVEIEIEAPGVSLSEVTLQWEVPSKSNSLLYNDHWERTYGDSTWHKLQGDQLFPWFFMEYNAGRTYGFGVKTGCAAFCGWLLSEGNMKLVIDTRNGGSGVELGDRKLRAAEIVTFKSKEGESHFNSTRRFARMMCDKPRLPEQPVYGINDWYFTYGNNSADLIMQHTALIAPMAEGIKNRPFSVIDDGWFVTTEKGASADVLTPNHKFGDMKKLAHRIKGTGMRPGLWTRPLLAVEHAHENLLLRSKTDQVYDPSIAENLDRVAVIFKTYKDWEYELVKFDYTSWDIFQKWGFQMLPDRKMSNASDWIMNDKSKTNAEIILNLYKTIREAAGDMYVMGCNTFSHLGAGLFELNRIGDDTSGMEWERTKKMGVNTLAARAFTHNIFYAADPDCVGLTTKIDWTKNRQWLELVAKSGTTLFISAQPEAIGRDQKQAIRNSLLYASHTLPVGQPIDWMQNPVPSIWELDGKVERFSW